MAMEALEQALAKLSRLIDEDRFEELESDTLEFKPTPPNRASWRECYKSACAFLNTRGGILVLGVRERGTGAARRYEVSGWNPDSEDILKALPEQFTDGQGRKLDVASAFREPMLRDFRGIRIAIQLIEELRADEKFAFYDREARKRLLTGGDRATAQEISRQEEYREEARRARELQPVAGVSMTDLSVDKLNDYITQLNWPTRIETVKPDIASAESFLRRKDFLAGPNVTTLGALVCGEHPGDLLGFRCHVHCYVDTARAPARDKRDIVDNILPLMEESYAYLMRNIHVGISIDRGGMAAPQYPEPLLREMVNNALAHRDYAINRQTIVAVRPGEHIEIRNPGSFPDHLLVERDGDNGPIRRILPEAKPLNPKLADVLRVFRKWEGKGIGMASLVDMCLEDRIDVPFYAFGTEEVALTLRAGNLLDARAKRIYSAYDRHIGDKMDGRALSRSQQLVLAYLMKSEELNARARFTILVSPANNHFGELAELERAGLISRHPSSESNYPIYIVDPVLGKKSLSAELRARFGDDLRHLSRLEYDALEVVYRYATWSNVGQTSAKQASFYLWADSGKPDDIKGFDRFYRQVRRAFNKLEQDGRIAKRPGHGRSAGYVLGSTPRQPSFL